MAQARPTPGLGQILEIWEPGNPEIWNPKNENSQFLNPCCQTWAPFGAIPGRFLHGLRKTKNAFSKKLVSVVDVHNIALATYLIPGCVGRGVRLGSESLSGGAGGVWKSVNQEIWEFGDLGIRRSVDLEIQKFGDLET